MFRYTKLHTMNKEDTRNFMQFSFYVTSWLFLVSHYRFLMRLILEIMNQNEISTRKSFVLFQNLINQLSLSVITIHYTQSSSSLSSTVSLIPVLTISCEYASKSNSKISVDGGAISLMLFSNGSKNRLDLSCL